MRIRESRVFLSLAVAAMLSACGSQSAPPAPRPSETPVAASSPVVLPPSIAASKRYRCADGGVASIEWYSDDVSASVSVGEGGRPVRVVAAAAGQPLVGGGFSVTGARGDATISLSTPEIPKARRCRS